MKSSEMAPESVSVKRHLCEMYAGIAGVVPDAVAVSADGSSRRYWRLSAGDNMPLIGCYGPDKIENKAFVYLSGLLGSVGVNVPRVVMCDNSGHEYLQTDLGSESLYDMISGQGCSSPRVRDMLRLSMVQLAKVHYLASPVVDFTRCFPRQAMDERCVMWDLNYFKYCFLKLCGLQFDEDRLQEDMERLASVISHKSHVLMLRDFQSRNIMIHDGAPWIIDFQGARKGPAAYDVVSFAWQARAGFDSADRAEIIDSYIGAARSYACFDETEFRESLPLCALLRLLQVLGAYGFRGYIERKSRFITPVPKAIALLRELLADNLFESLPYMSSLLKEMASLKIFAEEPARDNLIVEVSSFSYKKGVPVDNSGNGGGFVFDCRAVHNPGRYDEYKHLTGLDAPVMEFLEKNGEINDFLENSWKLVSHSVKRYLERGFTHLCVHFGCTGGRHRSVYSAQHMAERINDEFGVEVRLLHREQGISQIFPKR